VLIGTPFNRLAAIGGGLTIEEIYSPSVEPAIANGQLWAIESDHRKAGLSPKVFSTTVCETAEAFPRQCFSVPFKEAH
jgi:hypothetical protein